MEKQEIFDKVKAIIADRLGVEESDIKPESRFEADLGGDSLDMVWFFMDAESEFGINIPDEDYPDTTDFTVQEACDKIEGFIN